jgi:hypothetical protein
MEREVVEGEDQKPNVQEQRPSGLPQQSTGLDESTYKECPLIYPDSSRELGE